MNTQLCSDDSSLCSIGGAPLVFLFREAGCKSTPILLSPKRFLSVSGCLPRPENGTRRPQGAHS